MNSIESMKMETVIRSPQNGTVAKLVHQEGVSYLLSSDDLSNCDRISAKQVRYWCSSKMLRLTIIAAKFERRKYWP